jgi:hypothetical protein
MSRKFKYLSVLALRRRGERQAADERILGDGEFVRSVNDESPHLVMRAVPYVMCPLIELLKNVPAVVLVPAVVPYSRAMVVLGSTFGFFFPDPSRCG